MVEKMLSMEAEGVLFFSLTVEFDVSAQNVNFLLDHLEELSIVIHPTWYYLCPKVGIQQKPNKLKLPHVQLPHLEHRTKFFSAKPSTKHMTEILKLVLSETLSNA